MWYKMENKTPIDRRQYPVWLIINHSGQEMAEYALWSDGIWWLNGHTLERIGLTLVAWFDLPHYR
jgi:hypothetical protein